MAEKLFYHRALKNRDNAVDLPPVFTDEGPFVAAVFLTCIVSKDG
jgi:hypothetical protein